VAESYQTIRSMRTACKESAHEVTRLLPDKFAIPGGMFYFNAVRDAIVFDDNTRTEILAKATAGCIDEEEGGDDGEISMSEASAQDEPSPLDVVQNLALRVTDFSWCYLSIPVWLRWFS
jgi:hypothetical protein